MSHLHIQPYVDGKPVPIRPPYTYDATAQVPSGASQPYLASALSANKTIPIPHEKAASLTAITGGTAGDGEHFIIDTRAEHEERTTGDEAQKAMRDLLSGAIGAIDISNVDINDAVVEGFVDSIRLMPHQIQGRAWMKERETGKKAGGILADVSLFFLIYCSKFDLHPHRTLVAASSICSPILTHVSDGFGQDNTNFNENSGRKAF